MFASSWAVGLFGGMARDVLCAQYVYVYESAVYLCCEHTRSLSWLILITASVKECLYQAVPCPGKTT